MGIAHKWYGTCDMEHMVWNNQQYATLHYTTNLLCMVCIIILQLRSKAEVGSSLWSAVFDDRQSLLIVQTGHQHYVHCSNGY